jgi:tripartite-type tricarboxylate transporter receptor subunit TctC
VPTSAGGTTDLLARLVASHIAARSGKQVVIDNRSGAGGNIGMEGVARAAPDGHTLGFANTGNITINPFLYKGMSFNPLTDLIPVASVGDAPQLLIVNGTLPVRTLKDFIALARSRPGQLNYASAGPGTTVHLAGHQFARLGGIDLVHVPYRGTAPAVTALVSGDVQMMSVSLGPVAGFVQSGALRVLAAASRQRVASVPQIPTSAEAGLPGYEMSTWFGLFAPRGTQPQIVAQLNDWIAEMLKDPAVLKRLADNSVEVLSLSPDGFARLIAADAQKWEQVVRDSGVSLQ